MDDAALHSCVIQGSDSSNGYTEYVLKVQRGFGGASKQWTVRHRYKDFSALNAQLAVAALRLPLPPKKLFGNRKQEFIADRLHGLQDFLNAVLAHPYLANCIAVRTFLEPKEAGDLQAQSLQSVSVCLRNLRGWTVIQPWHNVGWRCSKQYFLVQPIDGERRKDVLAWSSYGPDHILDAATTHSVLSFVLSLRHPYIQIPMFTWSSEAGSLTVRQMMLDGTLRDQITRAKPGDSFHKKYCNPDTIFPLELEDIKYIGRHILEAMKFLHRLGIPYCQLHCGNLSITTHGCEITDLEGAILGLSSFYRPFYIQLRAVQTIEDIEVYCFAQTLYEMATGEPLHQAHLLSAAIDCDRRIRPLILSLLSPDILSSKLPTLDELINNDIFRSVPVIKSNCKQYSMPAKVKKALDKCREQIESRLKVEQTEFRHALKTLKLQAYVNSEEQRKERRKLLKQLSSVGKEKTQSNATPTSPTTPEAPLAETPEPTPKIEEKPAEEEILEPPDTEILPDIESVQIKTPSNSSNDRSALLQSIQGFSKGKLRKVATNDRSAPVK